MNRLGNGQSMNVHCQSGDDDLGNQVLADGDEFGWAFSTNTLGTTLFYCNVNWFKNDWFHFDAYSHERDWSRCRSECRWRVSEDGLYLHNQKNGEWEAMPLLRA
ncbi:PREDICTED: uncharacterized protein LOC104591361 [Nelumbo nucifera]|nr:PREDICTED: uncharacterized protein LOC104591361 [Nelumbo nucifera]